MQCIIILFKQISELAPTWYTLHLHVLVGLKQCLACRKSWFYAYNVWVMVVDFIGYCIFLVVLKLINLTSKLMNYGWWKEFIVPFTRCFPEHLSSTQVRHKWSSCNTQVLPSNTLVLPRITQVLLQYYSRSMKTLQNHFTWSETQCTQAYLVLLGNPEKLPEYAAVSMGITPPVPGNSW
jgi:hypothetical protein